MGTLGCFSHPWRCHLWVDHSFIRWTSTKPPICEMQGTNTARGKKKKCLEAFYGIMATSWAAGDLSKILILGLDLWIHPQMTHFPPEPHSLLSLNHVLITCLSWIAKVPAVGLGRTTPEIVLSFCGEEESQTVIAKCLKSVSSQDRTLMRLFRLAFCLVSSFGLVIWCKHYFTR